MNQCSWSSYTCETVCSPVDSPDNGQPSFIQPSLQRCLGGSGLRTIIMHGHKSWDTFAFLGRFPIHTGPTTPLIPQNNVGRVFPDFFPSFNFKVLYMQKLRCNYNINICNPSNFKKFFCALPTITDTKPRSRGCPQ